MPYSSTMAPILLLSHLLTGEVAAWPFAEEKADRAALPVTHHRSFAGEAPFGTAHQARVGAPFLRLEAVRWALMQVASIISTSSGSPPALRRCVGFCLSAGGAGQLGEDQLDNAPSPTSDGSGWWGFCKAHGRLGHPRERRLERSTWMMPLNTLRSFPRPTPRDLGKKDWILSSCSSLSRNKPSALPPPEGFLGIPLARKGISSPVYGA